jgi:hypothetical protein
MNKDVAIVSSLCAVLLACSSSSSSGRQGSDASMEAGDTTGPAGDDAGHQDASESDGTGGSTSDATSDGPSSDAGSADDADDGPACALAMYTMADYEGFADSGAYPNLPCGGCAPTSTTCYAGTPDGHGYACWSGSMQPAPPFPSASCLAGGVDIESGKPNLFDVCCP